MKKYDQEIGGFNVSNLMGITRRMIDIRKKITFYFLQNVWKCTVFFAFAFSDSKKCYYDPKNFFLEKYQYGYKKKAKFYADFKFVDANLNKCPPKKSKSQKTMRILSIFVFVHFFVVVCFLLLLGAFLKTGINEFEISIKSWVFFIPILIFFKKIFFGA